MNQNPNQTDLLKESWSTFYRYQVEARKKYRSIWQVPLIKKLPHAFLPLLKEGQSVLDVGAHDRKLGTQLTALIPGIQYKSMDIDPVGNHDYHSMDEIEERFDAVCLSEVIEHLTFSDGVELLRQVARVLKPGGYVVVSTPNMKHPHRYWTSPDHVTPYNYDALAGLVMASGFQIECLYRVHNQPFPQFYFRRWIGVWLHRYLDIDFALSIVAVGRLADKQ